jgi:hypothetical protein
MRDGVGGVLGADDFAAYSVGAFGEGYVKHSIEAEAGSGYPRTCST